MSRSVRTTRGLGYGVLALLFSALLLMNAACSSGGSGSSKGNGSIAVQFTAPTSGTAIDVGQTLALTVSIANDSSNQGVTWSLQTAFGNPVGTLTNTGSTAATYNAPSSLTTALAQISVVATSVADPTVSAAVNVNIEPLPQITSGSPTPSYIGCPAAGTVITGLGSGFGTVWTQGVTTLNYYLTATGGATPYTWSVSSGTLPAGLSLTSPASGQTVISGSATTPGCSSITMQVTDAAGGIATVPYYVVVLPPALVVQPPPMAIPQVGVAYPPTSLAANNGTAPYFWSLNPATFLPSGLTLSSPAQNPNAAVISGTPDSTGLGQFYSPSLIVYDSQLPYPATAQPGIAISQVVNPDPSCHSGFESNLSAQSPYAFLLRGFDAHGPVVIAGNFTVDGAGNVTGGTEDINRSSGVQTNLSIVASGSSYTVGPDNRGCLTLVNSAGATTTFRFALGTCSTSANLSGGCQTGGYFTRGRILEDDSTSATRASGILRLQDSSTFSNSGLAGSYVLGLSGWDGSGGRYALAGSAQASSGNLSSVAADVNDAGTLSSALTGGSGTYTIASNGRGTGSLTVGAANLDLAVYPVSTSEAIVMTTDQLAAAHPMLSGEVLAATSAKNADLKNTYMFRMAGVTSGAPDPNIGLLSFDGTSVVKGTIYENAGGTTSSATISGNYGVDANGRLTFAATQTNQNLGPHPMVAYVTGAASGVAAFAVSTDASAQFGVLEFQNVNPAVTTFNTLSIVGPHFLGTDEDLAAATWNFVGTANPNGNGSNAGCLCDVSGPGSNGLVPNEGFVATYSVSKTGTGYFGGQTVSVTNGATTYYIDESPLDLSPAITVVEQ